MHAVLIAYKFIGEIERVRAPVKERGVLMGESWGKANTNTYIHIYIYIYIYIYVHIYIESEREILCTKPVLCFLLCYGHLTHPRTHAHPIDTHLRRHTPIQTVPVPPTQT